MPRCPHPPGPSLPNPGPGYDSHISTSLGDPKGHQVLYHVRKISSPLIFWGGQRQCLSRWPQVCIRVSTTTPRLMRLMSRHLLQPSWRFRWTGCFELSPHFLQPSSASWTMCSPMRTCALQAHSLHFEVAFESPPGAWRVGTSYLRGVAGEGGLDSCEPCCQPLWQVSFMFSKSRENA